MRGSRSHVERDGELRPSQVRDILNQTYSFLLDIWRSTGYVSESATEVFARGRGREIPKLRDVLLKQLNQLREDSRDRHLQPACVDITRKPASDENGAAGVQFKKNQALVSVSSALGPESLGVGPRVHWRRK